MTFPLYGPDAYELVEALLRLPCLLPHPIDYTTAPSCLLSEVPPSTLATDSCLARRVPVVCSTHLTACSLGIDPPLADTIPINLSCAASLHPSIPFVWLSVESAL